MRLEVIVEQNEAGEFQAKAVEYPGVNATGRTEKEALVRLLDALVTSQERFVQQVIADDVRIAGIPLGDPTP